MGELRNTNRRNKIYSWTGATQGLDSEQEGIEAAWQQKTIIESSQYR